jgi:sugar lactone lactonase YvrE
MFMNSPAFTSCVDIETPLGEGPVWDSDRCLLWFVDIVLPAIFSFDPETARLERYDMPVAVTSLGLTMDERLIVSTDKDVCYFDPADGMLDRLTTPETDRGMNRLNDGKIGPDGAFWVGSMHITRPSEPTAALYRVTPDGNCTRMIDNIHVSNGLAWSPDHRTMYHADSRAPFIKAWDFVPSNGNISNPRLLAAPSLEEGLPDGAAVDTEGNYWCAGVTGGCIHVFAPDGALLQRIDVPMAAPTMPCFGGRNGDMLFLTGLTRKSETGVSLGRLMACRVEARGVPVSRFGVALA